MDSLSGLPERHYYQTEKSVSGGNKTDQRDMENKVEAFLNSGGLGHIRDLGGSIILSAKDSTKLIGVRGSGSHARVDIQGPEGRMAVRIAYQKGGAVNAQVIIPLNKEIPRDEFVQAFKDSMISKKVVSFVDPGQENIDPAGGGAPFSHKKRSKRT
ncbi:MAG: hypothetical protein Q8K75_01510 [Chlamydiales bacterium]|nr:hypothetical protein [Chlamydiales bacterium]